jgi:hypothetical protein
MARVRSVLIDNTIGRIFRNTTSVGTATAANLIAGNKLESAAIIASKKAIVRPALNIGNGAGMYFAGGAIVNLFQLTVSTAPVGSSIVITAKLGLSYDTSAVVGTYTLPALSNSYSYPVAVSVPVGQSLYFDINEAGSVKPGAGLGIRANFYRG